MLIQTEDLGFVPYSIARAIQDRFVVERLAGERGDTIILCEHPPTITIGRRTSAEDIDRSNLYFAEHGIEIVETDRGGSATYHGPGQLVIYPVCSLRENGIGVKNFVLGGLSVIAAALNRQDIGARPMLERAGVWVNAHNGSDKKIGAVGLRIHHGVTNHGFSLNFSSDIDVYSYFRPCGLTEGVTSVAKELQLKGRSSEVISAQALTQEIVSGFASVLGQS